VGGTEFYANLIDFYPPQWMFYFESFDAARQLCKDFISAL
jgi:hypothetical protein